MEVLVYERQHPDADKRCKLFFSILKSKGGGLLELKPHSAGSAKANKQRRKIRSNQPKRLSKPEANIRWRNREKGR